MSRFGATKLSTCVSKATRNWAVLLKQYSQEQLSKKRNNKRFEIDKNMAVFLSLFAIFVIFCLIKLSIRPNNFPPGPRGLPLIGYIPLFPKYKPVYKVLQDMAKTYGPVMAFYIGPNQGLISVTGQKAVREAMLNQNLDGRPYWPIVQERTYRQKLGLAFVDGHLWHEQRRFALRHLRELGFGKTSIEDTILDEVNDLITEIKTISNSSCEHVVEFGPIFMVSVVNILWVIIGGKRYSRNDVVFQNLLTNIDKFFRASKTVNVVFPLPAFIFRLFPSISKLLGADMKLFLPVQKFIEESIEEHVKNRFEGDAPNDFIDAYLDEMQKQKDKTKSTTFTKKQLVCAIQDLFTAGSETSSSTIGFAILYLIHHPEVRHKMQAELDDVCGEFLPSLAHRPQLPYTEAVLMEVMRICTVLPFGVPHYALNDTKLQGFDIPKGSVVLANFDSVFTDRQIWKDPENFRPERHLDENKNIIKNEALTPFGIGKRMCLGEPLAKNTVFFFVAALVKTFEFKPLPDKPLPSLRPIYGFSLGPGSFKAIVEQRK